MYTPTFDYFLIIAEEMNFSRAAGRCHVTQQSISDYMRRLERHYNTPLFVRTPSLQLTEFGETVLKAAKEIQQITSRLHSDIASQQNADCSITIGIASPLGKLSAKLLPIVHLSQVFPQAHITVLEEDLPLLLPQLQNGSIDILISAAQSYLPGIVQLDLRKTFHYILISDSLLQSHFSDQYPACIQEWQHGVSLLTFTSIPAIFYSTGGSTLNQIYSFCYANGVSLSSLGTVNNAIGIIQAVSEQFAWGYCPEGTLPALTDSYFINNGIKIYAFPIIVPDLSFTIYLSYRQRSHYPPGFKTVLKELTTMKMTTAPIRTR